MNMGFKFGLESLIMKDDSIFYLIMWARQLGETEKLGPDALNCQRIDVFFQ